MTKSQLNVLGNQYLVNKMTKEIVEVLLIGAAALGLSWFAVNYIEELSWKRFMNKENKK